MTAVRFHPEAEAELNHEIAWYDSAAPGLGERLVAEARRVVSSLGAFPHVGSPWRLGTRRVVMRAFPFSVVYRVVRGDVVIVAFAHFARRPTYWRSRQP
ncbi:MAG: type II toxin-antitoxin system RelE/ParE family toxin [Burkholderiales bacterium]|nr:type II toxin-antitoxin system RelE/ParE family toxin [Burkholderiales bacterium]